MYAPLRAWAEVLFISLMLCRSRISLFESVRWDVKCFTEILYLQLSGTPFSEDLGVLPSGSVFVFMIAMMKSPANDIRVK